MDKAKLAEALKEAAAAIRDTPALIWDKVPEYEHGLNSDAINKLAGKKVIQTIDRDGSKILRIKTPEGELEILHWMPDFIADDEYKRRNRQIARLSEWLFRWAADLAPSKESGQSKPGKTKTSSGKFKTPTCPHCKGKRRVVSSPAGVRKIKCDPCNRIWTILRK